MSIVIVLNNYFHDFSVALLFACLLVIGYMERRMREGDAAAVRDFVVRMYTALKPVMTGAWVFIVLGGVLRTLTYADYEWSEAAGRGQVAALIVKHVLLVSLVVWGVVLQRRLGRRLRTEDGREAAT